MKALYTPCHTQDSICWYMEDGSEKVVFTGDTLFIGGMSKACAILVEQLWLTSLQDVGGFSREHQQR